MRGKRQWFLCLIFISIYTSTPAVQAEDILNVMVSIVPQKFFVKKIGGDRVRVSVMVLPGANPATYEPKPRQMAGLARAGIYFAVDVPFERIWLKKFASLNPGMKIVHTEDGIEKLPMKTRGRRPGEGSGQVKDPHIWLSPPLVMLQARRIFCALAQADPGHEKSYEGNYRAFVREIVELDLRIRKVFAAKGQGRRRFMVYHPAWGYFARAYGLEQIPVEIEGKEPSAGGLRDLILLARERGIKVIFVQPQLASKSARTIAQSAGCHVLPADPLAENWPENLLDVAEKFSKGAGM